MRAPKTAAIATGVMIGLSAVAPSATAQVPTAPTVSVSAHGGHNWAVKDAQRAFWSDMRQMRREFRADVREARREFRQDIREARQDVRAKYMQARQELRVALREARTAFHAAIAGANDTFQTSISTSRDTLLAVLQNPAATREQRRAAMLTYRSEAKQAREVRHAAVKAAIAQYKTARAEARKDFREAIGR